MGTGFTGLSNYIATHIPRDTQSERGYYNLFSCCLLLISAPKDLRRKTHTKSLDGQKGTPHDRAANVLNFYTSQKERSFQNQKQFAKCLIFPIKYYRLGAKLISHFCFNRLYVFISNTNIDYFLFNFNFFIIFCTYIMNFTFLLLVHQRAFS